MTLMLHTLRIRFVFLCCAWAHGQVLGTLNLCSRQHSPNSITQKVWARRNRFSVISSFYRSIITIPYSDIQNIDLITVNVNKKWAIRSWIFEPLMTMKKWIICSRMIECQLAKSRSARLLSAGRNPRSYPAHDCEKSTSRWVQPTSWYSQINLSTWRRADLWSQSCCSFRCDPRWP